MTSRLRTAVIGTGFVGPHHVDAVRRGGYADVAVLVGSDPDRTRARAAALGVPAATTDTDSVLRDPDVDVVHVCTPNRSHVALATAVLEAGKHLVLEKPIAVDRAGAQAVQDAAERAGRHAMVALTYRGYPMVRRARDLVIGGALGEVRLVHGGYLQDWLARPGDWNWRVDPAEGGRSRAVADIGTHWLDLAEFVTGLRVEALFADLARFIPVRERPSGGAIAFGASGGDRHPVTVDSEDAAGILLRFAGGARGAVVISQVSPGFKNRLTIDVSGTDQSLSWEQESPEELRLAGLEESRTLRRAPDAGVAASGVPGVPSLPAGHPEGWGEALADLLRPFYAAVAAGTPPAGTTGTTGYPTLRDGARSIDLVQAALDSDAEGAWVRVA